MKYYIIFFDKSIKIITDGFYEKILNATQTEAIGIEIGNAFYKFTSISKILNEPDFFEQYPQYRNESHQPYSELNEQGYKIISPEKRKQLLLKGLKKVKPQATMKDLDNITFSMPKVYTPKYKNYEEAKLAGAFKDL